VATKRIASNFSRGETPTEFKAPSMKRACFWRFLLKPTNQVCFHWIDKF